MGLYEPRTPCHTSSSDRLRLNAVVQVEGALSEALEQLARGNAQIETLTEQVVEGSDQFESLTAQLSEERNRADGLQVMLGWGLWSGLGLQLRLGLGPGLTLGLGLGLRLTLGLGLGLGLTLGLGLGLGFAATAVARTGTLGTFGRSVLGGNSNGVRCIVHSNWGASCQHRHRFSNYQCRPNLPLSLTLTLTLM